MQKLRKLIDFLWGDVAYFSGLTRTVLKIILASCLALLCHEVLANILFSVSSQNISVLQKAVQETNKILEGTPIDSRFAKTPLQICLDTKPLPTFCSSTIFNQSGSPYRALGFQLIASSAKGTQRIDDVTIFEVQSFGMISSPRIKASTDNILRMIERAAFNPEGVPVTELKLCAGTQKLQTGSNCAVTTRIGSLFEKPIDSMINKLRIGALLIGPIQFATLCIFFYGLIELLGLWLRWVRPEPVLYSVTYGADGAKLSLENLVNAMTVYAASPVRSLGDRLFLRSLAAANVDAAKNESVTNEEIVSTLEAYRVFLLDDSVSRQEPLDMLGDTMLKLAFLGTVYGISTALFSARGLDTADPLAKLAAKAEMYSGIGVGFGTTLVGIILSIAAAIMRSNLSSAWAEQIGTAYRLILDFNAKQLRVVAQDLPGSGTLVSTRVPSPSHWDTMQVFGVAIALIGVLLTAIYFSSSFLVGGD